MKRTLLPITALLCLVLSGCAQYNLGQRIREGGEIHTGVDVLSPAQGKLYRTPGMAEAHTAYAQLPEVTCRLQTPIITTPADSDGERRRVRNATPTGQTRAALILCASSDGATRQTPEPRSFIKLVDTIPADALPIDAGKAAEGAQEQPGSYGWLSTTECGWGRRLAAAPFDYAIDPVLSAAHTILAVPVAIVATPGFLIWKLCAGEH